MYAQICKSEQGLAIHIPEDLATQASLKEGMEVEITIVDGKVVITLVYSPYDLDELLARVTPENLHGEIDTGAPVGNEIW